MKKGIIVLLITVLAAGMVFADFSGNANIQFNADLDKKTFGLANGTKFGFSFKVDSEVAKIAGESPVHAELEATANLIVAKDYAGGQDALSIWSNQDSSETEEGAILVYTPAVDDGTTKTPANAEAKVGDVTTYSHPYGFGLVLKVKSAKIVGENWSISILGAQSSAYNYASASSLLNAVFNYKDSFGNNCDFNYYGASYSVSYKKAPGLTATYDGFTASFGFKKSADGTAYSATLETKEFAFADDMLKIQAAAEASKEAKKEVTNIGASAKIAFAKDDISAKVATDFGFEGVGGDKVKVQFDASLAAAYDFISATAYVFKGDHITSVYDVYDPETKKTTYAYENLYLEATLGVDLNKFDVPVSVSVAAKNIIDKSEKGISLSASLAYATDAITVAADFSINTKAPSTSWDLNVYGIYANEMFTAGANVYYAAVKKTVTFGAFAESSALIEGVTLGLNYGLDSTSFLNKGGAYCLGYALNTNSFGSDAKTLGTASAYCKIAF